MSSKPPMKKEPPTAPTSGEELYKAKLAEITEKAEALKKKSVSVQSRKILELQKEYDQLLFRWNNPPFKECDKDGKPIFTRDFALKDCPSDDDEIFPFKVEYKKLIEEKEAQIAAFVEKQIKH